MSRVNYRTEKILDESYDIEEYFDVDGKLSRLDGPALIRRLGKRIVEEIYAIDGEYSRPDGGPTKINYSNRTIESWAVGEVSLNLQPILSREEEPAYIERVRGQIRLEAYVVDGQFERGGLPTFLSYGEKDRQFYAVGNFCSNERFLTLHREIGAALREYSLALGKGHRRYLSREEWRYNGELGRKDADESEDHPSRIEYFETGDRRSVIYAYDGKITRKNGPAVTEYFDEDPSIISREEWHFNNMEGHFDESIDLPALIKYHPDGSVYRKEWIHRGKYFRRHGPDFIQLDYDGKIVDSSTRRSEIIQN